MSGIGGPRIHEYDACACGKRKQAESPRCASCTMRLRHAQAKQIDPARIASARECMRGLLRKIIAREQI